MQHGRGHGDRRRVVDRLPKRARGPCSPVMRRIMPIFDQAKAIIEYLARGIEFTELSLLRLRLSKPR